MASRTGGGRCRHGDFDFHPESSGVGSDGVRGHHSSVALDKPANGDQVDGGLSTGVIGYVTEKTGSPILDEFGRDAHGALEPVAVMSVLETFDPEAIAESIGEHPSSATETVPVATRTRSGSFCAAPWTVVRTTRVAARRVILGVLT